MACFIKHFDLLNSTQKACKLKRIIWLHSLGCSILGKYNDTYVINIYKATVVLNKLCKYLNWL